MAKHYLTTADNPYDPRINFDEWLHFDMEKGYGTCDYLARIAKISEGLSDQQNEEIIEKAIDEIIAVNGDFYKKI